jgi:hypothetical protein
MQTLPDAALTIAESSTDDRVPRWKEHRQAVYLDKRFRLMPPQTTQRHSDLRGCRVDRRCCRWQVAVAQDPSPARRHEAHRSGLKAGRLAGTGRRRRGHWPGHRRVRPARQPGRARRMLRSRSLAARRLSPDCRQPVLTPDVHELCDPADRAGPASDVRDLSAVARNRAGTHRRWSRRSLTRDHERSGDHRVHSAVTFTGDSPVPIDARPAASSGTRSYGW